MCFHWLCLYIISRPGLDRAKGSHIPSADLVSSLWTSSGSLVLPSSIPVTSERTLSTAEVAADDLAVLDMLDSDVKAVACNTIRAKVVTAPVYWVFISSLSKRCSRASLAGVS